jgi:uncharacterized membrane protein (DUF485 family)
MSRFFARLALSIAALLVVMFAVPFAAGFFAYALYLLLAGFMPPFLAALLTGILILLFASLMAVAVLAGTWKKRAGETEKMRVARETMAELGGDLGKKVADHLESNKPGVLLASLAAGFVVGISPKLRQFLADILKK